MRQMRLNEAVETCGDVNHILYLEQREGRQQGEVIVLESPISTGGFTGYC